MTKDRKEINGITLEPKSMHEIGISMPDSGLTIDGKLWRGYAYLTRTNDAPDTWRIVERRFKRMGDRKHKSGIYRFTAGWREVQPTQSDFKELNAYLSSVINSIPDRDEWLMGKAREKILLQIEEQEREANYRKNMMERYAKQYEESLAKIAELRSQLG